MGRYRLRFAFWRICFPWPPVAFFDRRFRAVPRRVNSDCWPGKDLYRGGGW